MAAKQLAEKLITSNTIAVFSKTWCPYCSKAKGVVSSLGLDKSKVAIFELDEEKEGEAVQAYLLEKTGQRSVPNIFIGGKHVGGSDDLAKAQSTGQLEKLLAAA